MLKVHVAVEMLLAACTCNIPTSPSNLKPRKLILIGLIGFFLPEIHMRSKYTELGYTSFAYHRGGTEMRPW